jgi:hypothetical protein
LLRTARLLDGKDVVRTVLTAAAPLLMIIDHTSAASNARELVPTSRRHCVCREHGPRGGCLRWTCSDNTSEIVTRMLRHDCVEWRTCCVGIGCAQLAADPPPAKLPAAAINPIYASRFTLTVRSTPSLIQRRGFHQALLRSVSLDRSRCPLPRPVLFLGKRKAAIPGGFMIILAGEIQQALSWAI